MRQAVHVFIHHDQRLDLLVNAELGRGGSSWQLVLHLFEAVQHVDTRHLPVKSLLGIGNDLFAMDGVAPEACKHAPGRQGCLV